MTQNHVVLGLTEFVPDYQVVQILLVEEGGKSQIFNIVYSIFFFFF
jgi:hypothetical protein